MNSSELKGYLTGLIIGDGFIDSGVTKRSFGIKNTQKDFIDKIKADLESCSPFNMTVKYYPAHDSCGCHYKEYWELRTKAHSYFNKKYNHFYDDHKHRRITSEAMNWLTPNGLANWYMSDGYICLVGKESNNIHSRRMDICTDRYDMKSIEVMCKVLLDKFGVETGVCKRGNFHRIRVRAKSYQTFINIVSPYIVPSMLYKLYLGYPDRPKVLDDKAWEFQQSLLSAIALTNNVEG